MRKIMNFRSNLLVLIGLSAFALFGIFGVPGGAQTMRSTKATPTPKKTVKATPKGMAPKKSPTSTRSTPKPTAKATPKPTPRTTPKPAESPQVIVSVTSARLRSEPSTSSETLQYLKIGAVYPVLDQNTGLVPDTRGQRENRVDLEHRIAAFYNCEAQRDIRCDRR